MKNRFLNLFILILVVFYSTFSSCNTKQPFKPDYSNIAGYVIGKETCDTNETNDYWLLDFNVYPNTPHVGDTLVLNGISYTNVLKVKGLDPRLKQVGMRVSIDYKKISSGELTTGCTVASPVVYFLKEIFIINQGEIR
ncbi:hypothetical protein FW778_10185 [Ginsengibacter hankyongi]|uniref:Lipoprotein n=1 Tax=Ginsengibacter hankyongi TaxID=2607284 RepID=A0A5J5IHP6_9BACT|nr:hypothetical protein [Ginsengibacter hankyongi]KAA9039193.1 hypothetical protein FW778_10185 [Ginsengibacter hankyongi]